MSWRVPAPLRFLSVLWLDRCVLSIRGALRHITNRGVELRDIHLDDRDRLFFLDLLAGVIRTYRWRQHQYCLMTNHFQQNLRAVEIGRVRAEVERYFATAVGGRTWRNETGRLAFALLARTESIALLPDIGTRLGISASGVSRMIQRAERSGRRRENSRTRFSNCDSE